MSEGELVRELWADGCAHVWKSRHMRCMTVMARYCPSCGLEQWRGLGDWYDKTLQPDAVTHQLRRY